MTELLMKSERLDPVFSATAVAGWPANAVEGLVRLGLFAETDRATSAVCNNCDLDHVEAVQWHREPGQKPRVCIACARSGLLWLNPDDLRRWVVRLSTLSQLVATAVGAVGGHKERVPGRVWKLGTVKASGRAWIGFLAVGLEREDGASVLDRVPEMQAANVVVFVPSTSPPLALWPTLARPVILPLTDLLTLGKNGLMADRAVLDAAVPPLARPVAKYPTEAFPTPTGTTWEYVELVVEDLRVVVRIGSAERPFGFVEAGFEDRRKKNVPDDVWQLLKTLANLGGTLGTGDRLTTKGDNLKQKVSNLRTRLRALLGIEDNPFHNVAKGKPYRAKFAIRSADGPTFRTPAGTTWGDITLTETTSGIEVSVTTASVGVAHGGQDDENADERWEATTSTVESARRYPLAALGLANPDGTANPTGEAFLAVLRSHGQLKRKPTDSGLLTLGKSLGQFFQLAGAPFVFDDARQLWTAKFEALSAVPASDR